MTETPQNSPAGLQSDSAAFRALTEIEMIAKALERAQERQLPKGLSRAQFGVLNRLARLDTAETVGELATAFDVAQPTMTSTVGQLKRKAYVESLTDPNDGRRHPLRLTAKGRAMRDAAVGDLEPLVGRIDGVDWRTLETQLTTLRHWIMEAGLTTYRR